MVLSLSSSFQVKFCENFTYEDNFNNTFFGKILPHTTAVATEFKAKIILFSETTKHKHEDLQKPIWDNSRQSVKICRICAIGGQSRSSLNTFIKVPYFSLAFSVFILYLCMLKSVKHTSSRLLRLFAVYLYIPPHDKEASITDI